MHRLRKDVPLTEVMDEREECVLRIDPRVSTSVGADSRLTMLVGAARDDECSAARDDECPAAGEDAASCASRRRCDVAPK